MEGSSHLLEQTLILLSASVAVVAVFRHLRLPPILGYLAVGVAVGPASLGLINDPEDVRLLAEYGVVFLLFTIGLEFSVSQLVAMRWSVLGLGGGQVAITSFGFALAAWLCDLSWQTAVVIGGALALSSTAIVTKQLAEQLALHTRHGRRAVGILLMQDLAVVPLLIVIPLFADQSANTSLGWELAIALAKAIAVFGLLIGVGRTLLRPLFREIAGARSNELFTLAALLVALFAAWTTHLAGLSLALGAFLAGIMLGETEFRHQIEAAIRPFRDVLLGLFFITVGMVVDPRVLASQWHLVVAIAAGMVALKLIAVYALVRGAGEDKATASRTALIIAQGGEFGFAAMSLALSSGLFAPHIGQIIIAAIVVSMVLAPFCISHYDRIVQACIRDGPDPAGERAKSTLSEHAAANRDHVVICGFGRTGQDIARFLDSEAIDYHALDMDPIRIRDAQPAGAYVSFGDATHSDILVAAGVERARMVAITFTEVSTTLRVIRNVRAIAPTIPIVVRTRDDVRMDEMEQAGATAVVPEVLEASLMLASQALILLDLPMTRVLRHVRSVRADRYRLFRGYFRGESPPDLEQADRYREQLHTMTLPEGAWAVGRRIGELPLEDSGVGIRAIRRDGHDGPDPHPDVVLTQDDILVLYGTPESIEITSEWLLSG